MIMAIRTAFMGIRGSVFVIIGAMLILSLSSCFGIKGQLFAEPGDEDPPRLRYDGYYYTTDIGPFQGMLGTVIAAIVLWEDGTAANLSVVGRLLGGYHQYPLEYGTLEEAHERAQERIQNFTGSVGEASWGNFLIEGDTVRIRVLVPSGNSSFYRSTVVEYKGIIISDVSFIIITPWLPPGSHRSVPRNWTYHLQPFDSIPQSDNWTHRLWKKE